MSHNELMVSPQNTGVKVSVGSAGLGAEAMFAISQRRMDVQCQHEKSLAKIATFRDLMIPNVEAVCEIAKENNDPTTLMQYAAYLANVLLND